MEEDVVPVIATPNATHDEAAQSLQVLHALISFASQACSNSIAAGNRKGRGIDRPITCDCMC